jgi:putative ABC transport system substrate-binding protein
MRRIAIFHLSGTNEGVSEAGSPSWRAFFAELRKRGFVEGGNLVVDRYAAESAIWQSIPPGLADLLARAPEVIVAESSTWVRGINAMRPDIPMVALVADPLGEGVVSSLARPGRNITGVASDTGASLLGKQLELLLELAPDRRHVACIGSSYANAAMRTLWRDAQMRGVSVQEYLVHTQFRQGDAKSHYANAFPFMVMEGADAALVFADPEHFLQADAIAGLSLEHRLPLISPFRNLTEAGGLASYGANRTDFEHRRAEYVARILNGAKTEHLPLQQPTNFEFAINLKTAKALGLTIPPTLLARADEVIE